MGHVFISHSSDDAALADYVVGVLEDAGFLCWIAPRDVAPGVVWAQAIVEAVRSSVGMVLLLTDNVNHSGHVVRELEAASEAGLAVVTLRLEDTTPAPALSFYIKPTHWIEASTDSVERYMTPLIDAVSGFQDYPRAAAQRRRRRRAPTRRRIDWPAATVVLLILALGVAWLAGVFDAPSSDEGAVAPIVQIETPGPGSLLSSADALVEGTVVGSAGRVFVNRVAVPVRRGKFRHVAALDGDGEHRIVITVDAAQDAPALAAVDVEVDSTAPRIELLDPPTSEHDSPEPAFLIRGRVVDVHPTKVHITSHNRLHGLFPSAAEGEGVGIKEGDAVVREVDVSADGTFAWPVGLLGGDSAAVEFRAEDATGLMSPPLAVQLFYRPAPEARGIGQGLIIRVAEDQMTCSISLGAEDGITPGMDFAVWREGRFCCAIRTTLVTGKETRAEVRRATALDAPRLGDTAIGHIGAR